MSGIRNAVVFVAIALVLAPAPAPAGEEPSARGVCVSAEVESGLYGETGRLSIRLAFRVEAPLPDRYRVVLHVADPSAGIAAVDASHVPPVPTDKWTKEEPVRYTVSAVVPEEDGGRPAVLILVALADPTLENGYRGRLEMAGEDPFGDRRYLVARVPSASGKASFEELRSAAKERADRGETEEAFQLLAEALRRAEALGGKIDVTTDLLSLSPPPGPPVSGPEQVRIDSMVAAEKLRWLRDRASDLLKAGELKLALRVMEKIGGVVQEERNTKVVGEPTQEKRAEKDIVDIKSRLLRDLPNEELKELRRVVDGAGEKPKKLVEAAKAAVKRKRLVFARRLLLEARLHRNADAKLEEQVGEILEGLEKRILYELTPEQEKRLLGVSDHPAFHRTGAVPSCCFIFLGPKDMVRAIPRSSTYRLDVASLLLTDLFGRSPVRAGERIVVYFKETYKGPATGGGGQIVVGGAKPDDRKTRVDSGLYYHELTHCVDDTRPVHGYKRGLTEGIANVGSIFVRDMFAGRKGRFESLSRGGRAALRRHHLDRENPYWLIPAYGPSEGMLTEILARHAPAEGDHVDWTMLGRFFRLYRASEVKSKRTHRIMAHMGRALAKAMGPGVWATLEEFRFPVDETTETEVDEQMDGLERTVWALMRTGQVDSLLALANRKDPAFIASRARYAALVVLMQQGKADSEKAASIRRRLGVIDQWYVIGPFYSGLATVFPPEHELLLDKEYVTAQGVAKWRVPELRARHLAKLDGRGVVRLDYGYPERAVTYALAHVTVPEETEALAYVGADDEVALWLNGRHVQRIHGRRPLFPDWERWPLRLVAGRNRIFLKVANHEGTTGFSLRLVRPDGRAIEGLTQDLARPEPLPVAPTPKWETVFRDVYTRRSLGRNYEVAAGKFTIRNKVLRGAKDGRDAGWRPFSVRPGFPQDRPAALFWLKPKKGEIPADFRWRIDLEKPVPPKTVLTWDGEGDELTLSGWSLILNPTKKKDRIRARIERYDYLHYATDVETPKEWKDGKIEVTRIDGMVTVTVGEAVVFDAVSCPPLRKRRVGLAVWGGEPGLTGMTLAYPKR